jgi:hypothetical protein
MPQTEPRVMQECPIDALEDRQHVDIVRRRAGP